MEPAKTTSSAPWIKLWSWTPRRMTASCRARPPPSATCIKWSNSLWMWRPHGSLLWACSRRPPQSFALRDPYQSGEAAENLPVPQKTKSPRRRVKLKSLLWLRKQREKLRMQRAARPSLPRSSAGPPSFLQPRHPNPSLLSPRQHPRSWQHLRSLKWSVLRHRSHRRGGEARRRPQPNLRRSKLWPLLKHRRSHPGPQGQLKKVMNKSYLLEMLILHISILGCVWLFFYRLLEQKLSGKRKSGELGADLPVAQMKKKRVSFGGHLSPELFDKRLPPDSPLRRGATPRRSLSLLRPKQSLLRRASVIGMLQVRLLWSTINCYFTEH